MRLVSPFYALSLKVALAGYLATSVALAESVEPVFGLSNLLPSAPGIAEAIRPQAAVSESDLQTPARRNAPLAPSPEVVARANRHQAEEVAQPDFDWRAIVAEAVRKPPVAVNSSDKPVAANEVSEITDASPQGRLVAAAQARRVGQAPAIEKVSISVSDLSLFRARALASENDLPAPKILEPEYPRHSKSTRSDQASSHAQDYSNE